MAIEWEDDNCWISAIMKKSDHYDFQSIDKYVRVSKTDFSETVMSIEEFKEFKKATNKR